MASIFLTTRNTRCNIGNSKSIVSAVVLMSTIKSPVACKIILIDQCRLRIIWSILAKTQSLSQERREISRNLHAVGKRPTLCQYFERFLLS